MDLYSDSYEDVLSCCGPSAIVLAYDHFVTLDYASPLNWVDNGWPRRGGGDFDHSIDVLVALSIYHRRRNGECCGFVCTLTTPLHPTEVQLRHHRWTLHSLHPLHIESLVTDPSCGESGWIRNGQWIAAAA